MLILNNADPLTELTALVAFAYGFAQDHSFVMNVLRDWVDALGAIVIPGDREKLVSVIMRFLNGLVFGALMLVTVSLSTWLAVFMTLCCVHELALGGYRWFKHVTRKSTKKPQTPPDYKTATSD